MVTERIETLVIGAGQAGLATGYHLQRRGRPFLIVDADDRVGGGWRRQWDTLRLYSPAAYDALPGMPFPAPRWSYPVKDEVADYLEAYADTFSLPVRLGVRVDSLRRAGGAYVAVCGDTVIEADNVVVCTGTFGRTPFVPDFASRLDSSIIQLHSSQYRRPSQLAEGPVLVVGASHSGGDIAYEAALSHRTTLCGRDTGQFPVPLSSPLAPVAFSAQLFVFRYVLTRSNPLGRHVMDEFRFMGGPALRVRASDLRARDVERVPLRVTDVKEGRPVLADGRVLSPATVIWATGFRQTFEWIQLPIFDVHGWPRERRGIVEEAPGLFFCGLGFQYAASSMLINGAGRDADFVVRQILRRPATRRAVDVAA